MSERLEAAVFTHQTSMQSLMMNLWHVKIWKSNSVSLLCLPHKGVEWGICRAWSVPTRHPSPWGSVTGDCRWTRFFEQSCHSGKRPSKNLDEREEILKPNWKKFYLVLMNYSPTPALLDLLKPWKMPKCIFWCLGIGRKRIGWNVSFLERIRSLVNGSPRIMGAKAQATMGFDWNHPPVHRRPILINPDELWQSSNGFGKTEFRNRLINYAANGTV